MSLASQYSNKIPFNKRWISAAIHANSRINWNQILESGLIECYQDASDLLAIVPPRGREEDIKNIKREDREEKAAASSSILFEIYQKENTKLPICMKLTDDRKEKSLARIKDNGFSEDFRKAVIKAQSCAFLLGSNDRGWKASFDWLIANGKNVYKVLEGKYDGLFEKEGESW
jgi:hypothetical protein